MKIVGLFSATKNDTSKIRPKKNSLEFIKNLGIKDDKFFGKDEKKAVLITPLKAYEILKDNGIELQYGSLGENILVDFDIMSYNVGDIIVCEGVRLEITQKCTLCSHLAYFDKRVPLLVKKDRGVYCKVLNDGEIKDGAEIEAY